MQLVDVSERTVSWSKESPGLSLVAQNIETGRELGEERTCIFMYT